MMIIPVRVFGDHWVNTDEVISILTDLPRCSPIILRMFTEGCSLQALDIVQRVSQLHDPNWVWVDQWPNAVESVPFHRKEQFNYSHFFWMAQKYWPQAIIKGPGHGVIGFFMGRQQLPRRRIFWDLWHDFADRCLFSIMPGNVSMPNSGFCPETIDQWVDPTQQHQFHHWWQSPPVGGLDGHSIQDQYDLSKNTNLSLLQHYHRFDIEIVAETYTLGDCYFVTEKTVRPLSAGKPMIIYGPANFLQRLRQQGFQTWKDLWDESYDQYQGPRRWQHMLRQLHLLMDLSSSQWRSLLDRSVEIANYNRQRLLEIKSKYGPGE